MFGVYNLRADIHTSPPLWC